MSETPTTNEPAPTHQRLVKRRTWHVAILCLAVFVCGMVVGSGLTVIAAVRHIRQGIAHPELRVDRWTHRIARRLDLGDAETAKVRPVIEVSMERFEAIHRDVYPRIEAELGRLETDVAAVLPPDKAATWREHFNTLRREWIAKPPPAE